MKINLLETVSGEALQVNGDHFRSFIKQQASLGLRVVMTRLAEVFVLPDDALH